MSMFTTIIHPKDGRGLQIHTGHDGGNVYRVGDIVDWWVDTNNYRCGSLLDGVYESYSNKGLDDFVVIKKHKVHAVCSRRFSEAYLIKKYKIKPPSKSLWTKEAYRKHREHQKAFDKEFKAKTKGMSKDAALAFCLTDNIWSKLGEEGFVRKILMPEEKK